MASDRSRPSQTMSRQREIVRNRPNRLKRSPSILQREPSNSILRHPVQAQFFGSHRNTFSSNCKIVPKRSQLTLPHFKFWVPQILRRKLANKNGAGSYISCCSSSLISHTRPMISTNVTIKSILWHNFGNAEQSAKKPGGDTKATPQTGNWFLPSQFSTRTSARSSARSGVRISRAHAAVSSAGERALRGSRPTSAGTTLPLRRQGRRPAPRVCTLQGEGRTRSPR